MIPSEEEKKKSWNRTFNAATDDPMNVSRARAANPLLGGAQNYDPATVGQPDPAPAKPTFIGEVLSSALTHSDDRAKIVAQKEALTKPVKPVAPAAAPPIIDGAGESGKEQPPAKAANPLTQGVDYSGQMSPEQRGMAAEAYRGAIDTATGTGPGTELDRMKNPQAGQGLDFGTMAKRFDAYKKDDGLLAMRNAREDLLGSGIQMSKDANGGLVISDAGNKVKPLTTAGGSSINMKEGNDVIARANATRGQMINSMIQAQGGNGVGILGGNQTNNDAMIRDVLRPIPGSRGLTANQTRVAADLKKQASDDNFRRQELAQRGQQSSQELAQREQQAGIMAGIEQQKLAGNPLDAQIKQQTLAAGKRTLAQQERIDALSASLQSETDPAKRATIMETMTALQGKGSNDRYIPIPQTDELGNKSTLLFDTVTRSPVSMSGATDGRGELPPGLVVGASTSQPAGQYQVNGKTVTIKDGKVAEIK